jgi:hypothetical protein
MVLLLCSNHAITAFILTSLHASHSNQLREVAWIRFVTLHKPVCFNAHFPLLTKFLLFQNFLYCRTSYILCLCSTKKLQARIPGI